MAVAFVSLFLGLWYGVVPAAVVTAPGVARVELLLDGRPAGVLVGEPFCTDVDLGPLLAPHELVAVARDARGGELGRARQFINRPRAAAEASFFVQRDGDGVDRVARLTWQSASREAPLRVTVRFDGRPLPARDLTRIAIPPHARERLHFLTAELEFPGHIGASAEALVGAPRNDQAGSAMTAVPLLLAPGAPAPRPQELAAAVALRGAPLEPVALEEGPAEAIFVLTRTATAELERIDAAFPARLLRRRPRLTRTQSMRFVLAAPDASRSGGARGFPISEDFVPSARNHVIAACGAVSRWDEASGAQRIGDAVALAAIAATARNRRRAVVLLLGPDARDASELAPAEVRRFLRTLRVPLFVFALGAADRDAPARWGPVTDASTPALLESAVLELSEHLDRQRVLWVAGEHPPEEIDVVAAAPGWRLAE